MSEGGKASRPGAGGNAPSKPAAEPSLPRAFRSMSPSASVGPGRFDGIRAERKQAAEQIDRTLKAWRSGDGKAAPTKIPSGGGVPLASGVRQRMEPKLGADLSSVRVHSDGESAK